MSQSESKTPVRVFSKKALANEVLGLDDASQINYLIRIGKILKPTYYLGNRPVWTDEDAAICQEMAFSEEPATKPPPRYKTAGGQSHD